MRKSALWTGFLKVTTATADPIATAANIKKNNCSIFEILLFSFKKSGLLELLQKGSPAGMVPRPLRSDPAFLFLYH
jgi:hypothetical protein